MADVKKGSMGSRIKLARENAGFSQAPLARRLGVTAGAVGQWEICSNDPLMDKVRRLAEILNVSADWLLGKQPESAKPASPAATAIEEARRLGEGAYLLGVDLTQVVTEARQRRWLLENRGGFEDANAFIAKYGLWSDGKRLF